jgi:hypothetical protein
VLAVRTYRSAKSSISSGQRVHSFDQRFHEPKPSAIEPIGRQRLQRNRACIAAALRSFQPNKPVLLIEDLLIWVKSS